MHVDAVWYLHGRGINIIGMDIVDSMTGWGYLPCGTTASSGIAHGLAVWGWLENGIAASDTKFARVVWNGRGKWSSATPVDLGARVGGSTKLGRLVPANIVGHVAIGDVDAPFVKRDAGTTRCNRNPRRSAKHGDRLPHVGGDLGVCSVPGIGVQVNGDQLHPGLNPQVTATCWAQPTGSSRHGWRNPGHAHTLGTAAIRGLLE